jgi:hypothetical protein
MPERGVHAASLSERDEGPEISGNFRSIYGEEHEWGVPLEKRNAGAMKAK